MASSSADTTSSAPRLKRVLTLWDLIFYGIVLIQPIAPVPLFGVAQKLSDGHFATIILIAMFAMMITAVSYGRMAALYPSAGSAYTYVGKGLNLRGIRSSARANKVLLFFMFIVVGFFIVLAVRYLFYSQGLRGLFSIQPFYDPKTFNSHRIWTATSFAAL